MKKVFLSLAVVAVLTVVSCKKADAPAEETVAADTTAVAADTTAVVADTTAVVADTTAAAPAAPAAEAPAAK
ncbi:hypothetical protein [Flavobacterium sp. 5]|uniref:hypothetical protein n=1 Tax=Flavobacterium sp. 5 TaxID=2035199 RepID=UPI000C2CDED8|nr:hypothetical protein [Flavobacterium sp. 5]PKB16109.1 hypothetical protein CLU82_1227 [Flavobacterium sp. 5]